MTDGPGQAPLRAFKTSPRSEQVPSRFCKLCELEDFADTTLRELMREAFASHVERFGLAFPTGLEYRKYWEVAMTLRAFRELGVLGAECELLGVGAGAEATLFWLTNHVRRVFATDLYLDNEEWAGQAPPTMLVDPGAYASCHWNPRRLVVQNMNALDLRYPDRSFDGVFSSSALEHFGDYADVRQALAEMERVLRPGGIVALSTEYRIAGNVRALPGTLFFEEHELVSLLLEGRSWELVEPLNVDLSQATLRDVVDFDEAAADVKECRDKWSRYPHIVLRHAAGVTWTSVHVVLRKPPGVSPQAWPASFLVAYQGYRAPTWNPSPVPDVTGFNEFLHELRSRELEKLPEGARTVLHGGAAGSWYLEWFEERYPTAVERQIGVEAFSPPPDPLPPNVQWLQCTLGDLSPVDDASVDLVFAGQVIEHLWPEDVAGFLAEAHRVLRPGGTTAIDSPNRLVTSRLDWDHPEHTVEFTVDEARRLLELAGFEAITIRGLWICFDSQRGRPLPLEELGDVGGWSSHRRVEAAAGRPEESFIWWAEAARGEREPDLAELGRLVQESYGIYRAWRFDRMHHTVGHERRLEDRRIVSGRQGKAGALLYGPYVPMPPGRWVARFRLAAGPLWRELDPHEPLGSVDVAIGDDHTVVAKCDLTARDLPPDGNERELELPFELDHTTFQAEFRAHTLGHVRMQAAYPVQIEPAACAATDAGRAADGFTP